MSYRERCMAGVFRKIMSHFGFYKEEDSGVKTLSVVTVGRANGSSTTITTKTRATSTTAEVAMVGGGRASVLGSTAGNKVVVQNVVVGERGYHRVIGYGNISPPAKHPPEKDAPKVATGFRVRVSVPIQKEPYAPVVIECSPGAGGVQGLRWYSEKLMVDEDGDIAQEFLDEVVTHVHGPSTGSEYLRNFPSFEVKMQTRPAKLRAPVCTLDGNVHLSVEPYTGAYRW